MSNKFLNTSGSDGDVTNGSLNIYGATLRAENLKSSMPVKTNSVRELISSKLDISDINNLQTDLEILNTKTIHISPILNIDKTQFANEIHADKFVINNQSGQAGYLMSDGSIIYSSQAGQPNIYLYNNNNSGVPEPTSGQIRANNVDNRNVTELYISHITSDGLDIDVFLQQITTISVIYLQDRNNSNNNVRFNVTGAIIDFPNNYVTVPVLFDISQGTGTIDFGDGHPLFMSIFDNSQLIDSRISAVEIKTQHITANSTTTNIGSILNMNNNRITNLGYPTDTQEAATKGYVDTSIQDLNISQYTTLTQFNDLESIVITNSNDIAPIKSATQNQSATTSLTTFIDSTQLLLDTNQFFGIKSADSLTNYLIVTPSTIQAYRNLNMNSNEITDVSGIKISGFESSNFFIKTDGTIDENDYLQATDSVITDLQNKTQLISANSTRTTFNKSSQFRLTNLDNFSVTLDVGLDTFPKFVISGTLVNSYIPMSMNTYKLNGIPNPVDNDDATNKQYVDTVDTALSGRMDILEGKTQNLSASVGSNQFDKNSLFVLRVSNADSFVVRNDSGISKLSVSNTGVQINSVPLSLQNQQIKLVAEPSISTDVATKGYVDTAISGGVGLSPYFRQVNQLAVVTTNGLVETTMTTTPIFGSYSWADTAVGQSRKWTIQGFQNRGTFAGVYTIRFKTGTTLNVEWILPSQNGAVSNLPFILEITTVRSTSNSLSYYAKFETVGASSVGYFLLSSQNQTGGIAPLNTIGQYNITIQSNLASCNLSFAYVEVMAMIK